MAPSRFCLSSKVAPGKQGSIPENKANSFLGPFGFCVVTVSALDVPVSRGKSASSGEVSVLLRRAGPKERATWRRRSGSPPPLTTRTPSTNQKGGR